MSQLLILWAFFSVIYNVSKDKPDNIVEMLYNLYLSQIIILISFFFLESSGICYWIC